MAERRVINRNSVCRLCGQMRRAPAQDVPDAPASLECCGRTMRMLSNEATVLANRMSEAERVEWLREGRR